MTGNDLVRFIQENKLGDMELSSGGAGGQVIFGEPIIVNGKDELSYCFYTEDLFGSFFVCKIELCHPIDETHAEFKEITSQEAFKLRGIE